MKRERERDGQARRKGKIVICGGEVQQKGDIQRDTDNQVTHKFIHSDILCIRTKKDCSATHLRICFIYMLKYTRNDLNINHSGILREGLDSCEILALTNIILMMFRHSRKKNVSYHFLSKHIVCLKITSNNHQTCAQRPLTLTRHVTCCLPSRSKEAWIFIPESNTATKTLVLILVSNKHFC